MVNFLPHVLIKGKWYYIDARLKQLRNVNDPNDFEDVNEEIIDFWKQRSIQGPVNPDLLLIDAIAANIEYLSTTEGDSVPCISIEELVGILEGQGYINADQVDALKQKI